MRKFFCAARSIVVRAEGFSKCRNGCLKRPHVAGWFWPLQQVSACRHYVISLGSCVRYKAPTRSACYKASTLRYPTREVLVRSRSHQRKQLTMFHPLPLAPQWRSMPIEVREQTLKLLARLLRAHRRAQLAGLLAAKGVRDE